MPVVENKTVLTAEDRTGGAFNSLERNTRQLEGNLKRLDDITGGFVGRFAGPAGIAAAAAAMARFTARGFQSIDALDDLSARLGIAIGDLSLMKYAADQTDTSIDQLARGALKLGGVFNDFVVGKGGPAVETLKRLGISYEQSFRTQNDAVGQFRLVADAIGRLPDGISRAATAQDIFGRGAEELIPLLSAGARGFSSLAAEAENAGLKISDLEAQKIRAADASIKQMNASLEFVSRTLAVKFAEGFNAATLGLSDFLTKLDEINQQFTLKVEGPSSRSLQEAGALAAKNFPALTIGPPLPEPPPVPEDPEIAKKREEERKKAEAEAKRKAEEMRRAAEQARKALLDQTLALEEQSLTQEQQIFTAYERQVAIVERAIEDKLITEQRGLDIIAGLRRKAFEQDKALNDARVADEQRVARAKREAEYAVVTDVLTAAGVRANIAANLVNYETLLQNQKVKTFVGLGADLLGAFGAQSKRAFKAAKAFAIAEAVINTYQGATKALSQGGFYGFAMAAAVIAAGLAQVQKIRSAQPGGGIGGGASGLGGGGGGNFTPIGPVNGNATGLGANAPPGQRAEATLVLNGRRFDREDAMEMVEWFNELAGDNANIRFTVREAA